VLDAATSAGEARIAGSTAIVAASLPGVALKKVPPGLPARSVPSACCVFVADVNVAASWLSFVR
jgi:hypothetical protein